MGKSQETFNKKEKEKKRQKKKQEKQQKREERKNNPTSGGDLDSMMVYVDEFGNLTDTPPDPTKKVKEISAESIELGIPKRIDEEPAIREGKVEFFNDQKGFGFIKEIITQEKYFVHVNGLIDEIQEGDKVTFDLEKGMKGMNAVNVKLVVKS